MRTAFALVTMIVFGNAAACADGLIHTLPADGSWVAYHATLTGGNSETNGKVVLKSVGKSLENGRPCRWIEIEYLPADGNSETTVYKTLIPEKSLTAGVDPLDFVVRAWEQRGQGDPQQLDDPMTLDASLLGAMLHGPVDEKQPLDEDKKFPYQRGTLTASGETGTRKVQLENLKGLLTSTTWPHEKVPFGVAGLLVRFRAENSPDELVIHLVVSDFGTDAKTKLPNAH